MSKMPVFTIQAKDEFAVEIILQYRDLCRRYGLLEQAIEVQTAIDEMIDWRMENHELVKLPSHKHVPVGETPIVDITPDPLLSKIE